MISDKKLLTGFIALILFVGLIPVLVVGEDGIPISGFIGATLAMVMVWCEIRVTPNNTKDYKALKAAKTQGRVYLVFGTALLCGVAAWFWLFVLLIIRKIQNG